MSVTVEKGKAAEIKGVKRVRGKQIAPCLSFKESDAKKTAHAKGKAAQRKAAEINGVKRVRGKQKAPCQSTKELAAKKTAYAKLKAAQRKAQKCADQKLVNFEGAPKKRLSACACGSWCELCHSPQGCAVEKALSLLRGKQNVAGQSTNEGDAKKTACGEAKPWNEKKMAEFEQDREILLTACRCGEWGKSETGALDWMANETVLTVLHPRDAALLKDADFLIALLGALKALHATKNYGPVERCVDLLLFGCATIGRRVDSFLELFLRGLAVGGSIPWVEETCSSAVDVLRLHKALASRNCLVDYAEREDRRLVLMMNVLFNRPRRDVVGLCHYVFPLFELDVNRYVWLRLAHEGGRHADDVKSRDGTGYERAVNFIEYLALVLFKSSTGEGGFRSKTGKRDKKGQFQSTLCSGIRILCGMAVQVKKDTFWGPPYPQYLCPICEDGCPYSKECEDGCLYSTSDAVNYGQAYHSTDNIWKKKNLQKKKDTLFSMVGKMLLEGILLDASNEVAILCGGGLVSWTRHFNLDAVFGGEIGESVTRVRDSGYEKIFLRRLLEWGSGRVCSTPTEKWGDICELVLLAIVRRCCSKEGCVEKFSGRARDETIREWKNCNTTDGCGGSRCWSCGCGKTGRNKGLWLVLNTGGLDYLYNKCKARGENGIREMILGMMSEDREFVTGVNDSKKHLDALSVLFQEAKKRDCATDAVCRFHEKLKAATGCLVGRSSRRKKPSKKVLENVQGEQVFEELRDGESTSDEEKTKNGDGPASEGAKKSKARTRVFDSSGWLGPSDISVPGHENGSGMLREAYRCQAEMAFHYLLALGHGENGAGSGFGGVSIVGSGQGCNDVCNTICESCIRHREEILRERVKKEASLAEAKVVLVERIKTFDWLHLGEGDVTEDAENQAFRDVVSARDAVRVFGQPSRPSLMSSCTKCRYGVVRKAVEERLMRPFCTVEAYSAIGKYRKRVNAEVHDRSHGCGSCCRAMSRTDAFKATSSVPWLPGLSDPKLDKNIRETLMHSRSCLDCCVGDSSRSASSDCRLRVLSPGYIGGGVFAVASPLVYPTSVYQRADKVRDFKLLAIYNVCVCVICV